MKNLSSKIFITILIIIVAGVGVYFYLNRSSYINNRVGTSFSKDGNLVKDNPGYIPGVWYLLYEEPGSPALSVQLNFDNVTLPDLSMGDRVQVEGVLRDSIVRVSKITSVNNNNNLKISLYYYNPSLDQGPGGAQCSKKGLVPVTRYIPKTTTPLKDAVNLLLRGEITDDEKSSGVTTEFPLQGVSLKSADITNGVATLTFDDPNNKTQGGSCRVGILWSQIESTAKQFPNIDRVEFKPKTLFQP